MAFPSTGVLDTFDRANSTTSLGANWTADAYGEGQGSLGVISNTAYSSDATTRSNFWNVADYGPDVEAHCTLSTASSDYIGLGIRLQDTGGAGGDVDGYAVEFQTTSIRVYRLDNTGFTQLGATITISPALANGDGVGAEMSGTTITVYKRVGGTWTSEGTRTDSTYSAAGKIALQIDLNTTRVDDYGGGTIVTSIFPLPDVVGDLRRNAVYRM